VVLIQKLQHAVPGAMLLFAGLQAIRENAHGVALALAGFEIVTSLLLVGSVLAAVAKARRPVNHAILPHVHHGGVDWIDVFTAGLLFAEAVEHWHLKHHVKGPTILMAASLLVIGLLHGRIARRAERRFTIRVGEDDLYIGGKPFRSLRTKWVDVASIDIGTRYATVTTRTGRARRLDLADLQGSDHVRAALEEARRRIASSTPAFPPGENVPPPAPSL
jgi:hypothetical protein